MKKIVNYILLIIVSMPSCVYCDIIDDIWGIINDPLKIQKGGASVIQAVNNASKTLVTLQKETDSDIREYIVELEKLINKVELGIETHSNQLIKHTVFQINKFIDKANNEIKSAIVQTECVIEVSLNDALKRALGGNLKFLGDDKLEIILPFKKTTKNYWGKFENDTIIIDLSKSLSPFKIYEIIRDRHIKNLEYANSKSQAKDIALVYADIARFARITHCYYRNDSYSLLLSREYTHYDNLVRLWLTTVQFPVGSS